MRNSDVRSTPTPQRAALKAAPRRPTVRWPYRHHEAWLLGAPHGFMALLLLILARDIKITP